MSNTDVSVFYYFLPCITIYHLVVNKDYHNSVNVIFVGCSHLANTNENGQLRTERNGDIEKGCQKPAVEQKTIDDDEVAGSCAKILN